MVKKGATSPVVYAKLEVEKAADAVAVRQHVVVVQVCVDELHGQIQRLHVL